MATPSGMPPAEAREPQLLRSAFVSREMLRWLAVGHQGFGFRLALRGASLPPGSGTPAGGASFNRQGINLPDDKVRTWRDQPAPVHRTGGIGGPTCDSWGTSVLPIRARCCRVGSAAD